MAVVLNPKLVAPPSTPTPQPAPPLSDQWVKPGQLANCIACDSCVDLALICGAVAGLLYRLSGRKFGVRRAAVRPTRIVTASSNWVLGGSGWQLAPASIFFCWDDADLVLNGPVTEIHAVKLNGTVLDASQYVLINKRVLRLTSGGAWPGNQNPAVPDTQPGTVLVDYSWGVPVPAGGRLAAQETACQYAKGANGEDCALPPNLVRQTRQGNTLDFAGSDWMAPGGSTGLPNVDRWVRSVNKAGAVRPPSVTSPDSMQGAVIG